MQALGAFSWRRPEDVEYFERGWTVTATFDGLDVHLRQGIDRRQVYGNRDFTL
jgi:hypothetical protein